MVFLVLGLLVGFVGSLLGIGGGVILVPFLHYIAKLSFREAIAVSLFAIVCTSLIASLKRMKQTELRLEHLPVFESCMMLGGLTGGYLGAFVSEFSLRMVFSTVLFFTAAMMIFKGGLTSFFRLEKTKKRRNADNMIMKTAAVGGILFVVGTIASMAGLGGGVLIVPTLVLVAGYSMREASSTSLYIMGIMAASALISQWGLVQTSIGEVFFLLGGIFLGAPIGFYLADRIPQLLLRRIFAVLLLFVSVKTIWQTWGLGL